MSKITVGEAIVRRKLKTRSTTKYAGGQGKVSKLSDEDAIVSYVDHSGSVNIIICEFHDDEWFHRGLVIVADCLTAEVRKIPRRVPLRGEVQTLLRAAYKKEESPQQSDKATGGTQPQGQES